MNIYDSITVYNRDEVRQASDYMDRLADAHRKRAFWRFVGGLLFLVVWGMFWAFVLCGWLDGGVR
jgi:hypothetical protein